MTNCSCWRLVKLERPKIGLLHINRYGDLMNISNKKKAVVCAVCGKVFQASNPNEKYCCLECRDKARKIRLRSWYSKYPNYNRDYMRRYRKKETKGNEIS